MIGEIGLVDKALLMAQAAHRGQMYGPFPYMLHIAEVHQIARQMMLNEQIEIACILHDTLEDSTVSYNDIRNHFGEDIAEIVYAVTDELGRNRKERKQKTYPKIYKSVPAQIVKLCDRLANVNSSKVHSSKMFKAYQNEHEDFLRLIISDESPDPVIEKLIELLEVELDLNSKDNA